MCVCVCVCGRVLCVYMYVRVCMCSCVYAFVCVREGENNISLQACWGWAEGLCDGLVLGIKPRLRGKTWRY